MDFLKDMFVFLGNAMVALVVSVFVVAILMEGYDFIVDTWEILSD